MNRFRSLDKAAQGQCFCSGQFAHRREPRFVQFLWPTTGMPADQANETVLLPNVTPVVDGLMTDAALLANGVRMLPFAQHQQSRGTQTCIPPRVIDRQLEQGFAFAGRQAQGYFHLVLSGVWS